MKKLLLASLLFIACSSNLQCKQLISNIDLQNINYTKQQKDNCVTHNLHTVLKSNGIEINEEKIYFYAKSPNGGVCMNKAEEYINYNYNITLNKISNVSKEAFINELNNGNIIFVAVKGDLYYNKSKYEGMLHYISIVGYGDEKFVILDTNRKELQGRNYDELMKCVSDKYVPCLYNLKN